MCNTHGCGNGGATSGGHDGGYGGDGDVSAHLHAHKQTCERARALTYAHHSLAHTAKSEAHTFTHGAEMALTMREHTEQATCTDVKLKQNRKTIE